MKPLQKLTIRSFHEGLLKKEFSALEIVQAYFDRIKELDGFDKLTIGKKIGAYLSLNEEEALKQAEEVDVAVAKNEEIGLLAGTPLAIKDNILIEDQPATAGSKILENYTASYDAFVIKKLKAAKSVFLGKTNLDEFAMGSSTENSAFQLTRNPHDLERVPGGTSGGSAAAVAAHMALAALGSDTGGSIRQPASFCGVVGLKPTYGAVSRYGLIATASSLDQIGIITKTVEDATILFKEIGGQDDFDSTSVDVKYDEKLLSRNLEDIRNLKIGLSKEYFIEGLDKAVASAIEEATNLLKSLKLEFKEISLPYTKYALPAYYIINPAEISANLARFDGVRYARIPKLKTENLKLSDIYFKQRMLFGREAKRRIILGTFVLSSGYYDAYYQKAQQVRALIKRDFDEAFKKVDVILTPVAPTPAFKIGEKIDDPLSMYLSDIFTIPVNLAGLPAIAIPARKYELGVKKLPVGFQLIGRPWREADILGLGQYYEKIAG